MSIHTTTSVQSTSASTVIRTMQLSTKDVAPQKLEKQLTDFVGISNFRVEMRHGAYHIESNMDFDAECLLESCRFDWS
ncbi:hypothetical protein PG984_002793 [Apiospora sp. TS-2023a]